MSDFELTTTKFLQEAQQNQPNQGDLGSSDVSFVDMTRKRKLKWEKGLTIVCILFILIGIGGTFSGGLGIAGLLTMKAPELEPVQFTGDAVAFKMEKRQHQIVEEQYLAREKYFWVLMYMEIMKLGIAGFMIAASILMLQANPKGRSIGSCVCGFAIFYHLCLVAVSVLLLSASAGSFQGMLDEALDGSVAEARAQGTHVSQEEIDAARNTMVGAAQIGMMIGLGFMLVIKIAFYSAIIIYLNRPHIKGIFGIDVLKEHEQRLAAQSMQPTG